MSLYYDCQPIYDVQEKDDKLYTLDGEGKKSAAVVPVLSNYNIDKCVNPLYQRYQSFENMDETNNINIKNTNKKKKNVMLIVFNVLLYIVVFISLYIIASKVSNNSKTIIITLFSAVIVFILLQFALAINKHNINSSEINFLSKTYEKKLPRTVKPEFSYSNTYLESLIEDAKINACASIKNKKKCNLNQSCQHIKKKGCIPRD